VTGLDLVVSLPRYGTSAHDPPNEDSVKTTTPRRLRLAWSILAGVLAGCVDEGSGPHRPEWTNDGSSSEGPETQWTMNFGQGSGTGELAVVSA